MPPAQTLPQTSLGIDIALRRSGLCLLQRATERQPWTVVRADILEIKPREKLDILSYAGYQTFSQKLRLTLADLPRPDFITIEHVTQYGHYQTALKIQTARAALYGVLAEVWQTRAEQVTEVKPQEWKRLLLGKPNADKDFTRQFVRLDPRLQRLTQDVADDPDLLDACLLALYAQHPLRP